LRLVAGVILAGILAATMSTADSQLLAASSSVSQNLAVEFFHLKISGKKSVFGPGPPWCACPCWRPSWPGILTVPCSGWCPSPGRASARPSVPLCSLPVLEAVHQVGALAGMVAGGAMVFIWKYLIAPRGGAWAIYELLPAFIVASAAIVVVSLLTAKPDAEIEKIFDEVRAN
jgi:sodium/proline symporter